MGGQWVLYECGFNQHVFEDVNKARNTGSAAREVLCSSSEPLLEVCSTWDACHVYAECSGAKGGGAESRTIATVTSGRWKEVLDELEGKLDSKKVMKIMEIGNQIIMKTVDKFLATKAIISGGSRDVNQVAILNTIGGHLFTKVDGIHSVQGSAQTYSRLTSGLVYSSTLNSSTADRQILELSTPILPGICFKKVSCGSDHVLLLTIGNGEVWSCGLGHRGQLGHGDLLSRAHPLSVEALDGIGIEDVACGNWHNLALSKYGDVYSWGWNADQQLGHSADTGTVAIPTLVELGDEVNLKFVSCGSRHSAALSVCGQLFTWGWNAYGQLGHPSSIGGMVLWMHCTPWSTLFLIHQES